MFAQVSHFDVLSELIQQWYRAILEHFIPALEMQNRYSGGLLLANSQQGKVPAVSLWASKIYTPPTRPPTGFVSSVLRPHKERSQTSRSTRSTSHDWIIHDLDRTREKGIWVMRASTIQDAYTALRRALGPRCLAGIFACFQTHYQLEGVMVRVTRDAHLVDHALDQEHSPSPRRLRILQLSLQVRSLRSQAR